VSAFEISIFMTIMKQTQGLSLPQHNTALEERFILNEDIVDVLQFLEF
jgi:hypothetical protein